MSAGTTIERYKWVRWDFLQRILDSGTHWNERTPLFNRLRANVSLDDVRTNAEFCASADIGPCWTPDPCPVLASSPRKTPRRPGRRGSV